MFLLDWYREFINIRLEARHCESCEILKQQLSIANQEIHKLMDRVLDKPEPTVKVEERREITMPRPITWKVRRQMLEQEDRERARVLRQAPKPDSELNNEIQEIEREMDIAGQTRATAIKQG